MSVRYRYNAYIEVPEKRRNKWCYDNYVNARSLNSAVSVRRQLERILKKLQIDVTNGGDYQNTYYFVNIRKCILSGFFMQVAHRERTGHYLTIKDNQVVKMYPSSVMKNKPDWVVFHEFVLTTANYMRTISSIEGEWLMEVAPHYYDLNSFPECSVKNELVAIEKRRQLMNERTMARRTH